MSENLKSLDEEIHRYEELVRHRVDQILERRSSARRAPPDTRAGLNAPTPLNVVSSTTDLSDRQAVNAPVFQNATVSHTQTPERPVTIIKRIRYMLGAALRRVAEWILSSFSRR